MLAALAPAWQKDGCTLVVVPHLAEAQELVAGLELPGFDADVRADEYVAQWDGRMSNGESAAAGIYLYRLTADGRESRPDVVKVVITNRRRGPGDGP